MGQRGVPSAGFGIRPVHEDEQDKPPEWNDVMRPDYRPTPAQARRQAQARASLYESPTDEEVCLEPACIKPSVCSPPVFTLCL